MVTFWVVDLFLLAFSSDLLCSSLDSLDVFVELVLLLVNQMKKPIKLKKLTNKKNCDVLKREVVFCRKLNKSLSDLSINAG